MSFRSCLNSIVPHGLPQGRPRFIENPRDRPAIIEWRRWAFFPRGTGLFGLAPTLQASRPDLVTALKWGFSFDEIAGMLGISAAAARARASRGMADLAALNHLQRARA